VFLSGEREIRETAESLRKHHPQGCEVLPLYSRLSQDEQQRVFRCRAGAASCSRPTSPRPR
jgi:ATP-dependent helicase HrpA